MCWSIGLEGSLFPNQKLNPSLSHTKDLKIVFDASLLSTQHFRVRMSSAFPRPRYTSHGKGSLQVIFDCTCKLYLYIYI